MFLMFLLINLFLIQAKAYPDSNCVEWFKKSKILKNSNSCISDCSVLMVDMSTFLCRNQCPELCSESPLTNYVFYPGLTSTEKALISKHPTESVTVYIKKNIAEEASLRNFPEQRISDEADAFRHFVWAAELTSELGADVAQKFLDAHEEDPIQKPEDKAMDLANNRGGILFAQKILKNKNYSLENVVKEALDQLRDKKMNVLRPGLEIPKEPNEKDT